MYQRECGAVLRSTFLLLQPSQHRVVLTKVVGRLYGLRALATHPRLRHQSMPAPLQFVTATPPSSSCAATARCRRNRSNGDPWGEACASPTA